MAFTNAPKPGEARANAVPDRIDRRAARAAVLATLKRYNCDPFAIMAKIANGDVVGLGMMTAEELAAEANGEFVRDEHGNRIDLLSGRDKANKLIPASLRHDASKDLACFVAPKLAPIAGEDGSQRAGVVSIPASVTLFLPENGR